MKKALPILSMISAFCCAVAILVEFFPAIVGHDYYIVDLIAYACGLIACITLVLWLIVGNRKHKIIAVIAIISEALLWMPINKFSTDVALFGLLTVNIISVFCSE